MAVGEGPKRRRLAVRPRTRRSQGGWALIGIPDAYAKWEMVKDLQAGTDALLASDLLCAMAGYEPAGQVIRDRQIPAELSDPDRVAPADEYLVLDADASQSYVINAAVRGSDLVVEGPPGTGKSQTIANLIATLVCRTAESGHLFRSNPDTRAALSGHPCG